ncbi:MatE efflux family protein [Microlunatus phosphovorus NM-1]|uniref:Probable multidrug resistance protein NorM n=1 Tax=Microlunatus phosphovorus (strain ATCC 700054 / DSM 10555 / JCM 9379 / NBRC 101784 / NCIMB 13414 / VKM Ac-1990 / NM-1) TaxID=1032480 RepID=F5XH65_MICPN|nr:MATE family efflux transporter [Microlunatus phosphovorus]BAK38073.1 MatE efflux family protein [Microlunatus phosphovorus NM-1]
MTGAADNAESAPAAATAPAAPAALPRRVRAAWIVTYPLIVASAASTTLAVVDTLLLGRFGTAALATIALATPVFVFGSALVVPWGTAVQVLIARLHGAEDTARIGRLLGIGLRVCLAAALLPTLTIIAAAPWILHVLAGGEVPVEASTVVRILACTLPLTAVTAHYRGVFGGLGRTRITMQVALGVNIVNIPLDVLLVYGLGLGAVGSALGTLAAVASGAGYIAWLARRELRPDYPAPPIHRSRWRRAAGGDEKAEGPASRALAGEVWKIGWPDTTFAVIVYGADVLLTAIVATIGTADLAGYRLMVTTVTVLWVVVFSCSSGISILAGQRLGADDEPGARAALRAGAVLMAGLCVLVVLLPLLVPYWYFGLFSTDRGVVDAATSAVWVLLLLVPAMVVAMSLAGLLRAGGDTKGIMYAGGLSQFVLALPVAWFAVQVLGWGIAGAYLGFATGILGRAVFTVLRWRQGRWRTALSSAAIGSK